MRPEEVGILVDHLRLKPQPKLQAQAVNRVGQLLHGAAQLLFVHHPVSQAGVIVVALAEPSVVQHQHFHAHLPGGPGEAQDFFGVEIKIRRFPAVDQHRPPALPPAGGDDLLPDEIVVMAAQPVQALPAVGQQGFRRLEGLPGREGPGKAVRMDARHQPGRPRLVHLHLLRVIAGIHQHAAVAAAGVLRGPALAQDDEGIAVVAAHAPAGAEDGYAPGQRAPLRHALHAVAAVEMDHVKVPVGKVHAGGSRFFHRQLPAADIDQPGGADDHVPGGEHMILQLYLQADDAVPQGQGQGFRILRFPHEGQPGQGLAALLHGIAREAQVRAAAAVFAQGLNRGQAEIPHAAAAVFLGQGIQGIAPVAGQLVGIAGKAPVGKAQEVVHVAAGLFAVIQVQQHAGCVGLHLVQGMRRLQGKDPRLFMILNTHLDASFCTVPGSARIFYGKFWRKPADRCTLLPGPPHRWARRF